MKKASRLYNALVVFLGQSQQWADVRHLYVLAWMVVGLISEGSVNLTRWIMSVQSKAKLAQSTQRRFQRWLYNPRINVQRLYSPLIQGVASSMAGRSFVSEPRHYYLVESILHYRG
jgi:hypothetical protein